MLIGSLENTEKAEALDSRFKKIFDYFRTHDFSEISLGKIDIAGDEAWIAVSDVEGKLPEDARLETHDRYIDIQLPLAGCEIFGWQARERLQQPLGEGYDAEHDITFYQDAPAFYFSLEAGRFAVFFPEDAHAPCIGKEKIRKAVAKVKV